MLLLSKLQEKMCLIFLRLSTQPEESICIQKANIPVFALRDGVIAANCNSRWKHWYSRSPTEAAASSLASSLYLCQPLQGINLFHPSQQLQMLVPFLLICPPAQPQMYRDIFTVTVACYRLQCLPHKSQQQHRGALNDNG